MAWEACEGPIKAAAQKQPKQANLLVFADIVLFSWSCWYALEKIV
jgi:hypothetical protein